MLVRLDRLDSARNPSSETCLHLAKLRLVRPHSARNPLSDTILPKIVQVEAGEGSEARHALSTGQCAQRFVRHLLTSSQVEAGEGAW
jgi:hypothetical protein